VLPVRTRYARSGDASLAFHVVGAGPVDLVYAPCPASQVELMWEEPTTARYLRRITSFARLVMFDRRGTGLSDAVDRPPTLEQQMDDVRAVMRAAGMERASLFGVTDAGLCALYAATYPDEVVSLVLWGVAASGAEAVTPELRTTFLDLAKEGWGEGGLLPLYAPGRVGDARFAEWFARYERAAVSPGMARRLLDLGIQVDIRDVLPAIGVPTLVLHRSGDRVVSVDLGRELAAHIPHASFVELPGEDNYPWTGDVDGWFDRFEQFLAGGTPRPAPADRVLSTVLFTDIVGSTELAGEMGDARWLELLDEHNAVVRRELAHWRGSEVKTTGDGFLATFDGPARAVRCAEAIIGAAKRVGLDLRAGIHSGECEIAGGDVGGIAVHIAARVVDRAGPAQVLVSSTVRDLVVGSGLQFADAGRHTLKGLSDEWQLYALDGEAR
jgi:class 3 adenylate cyclase/pimeloyl-ACP methyl ester carboxylesterase